MRIRRRQNTLNRMMLVESLEHRICLAGDAPTECHFATDSTAEFARAAHSINCFAGNLYEHLQAEEGNLLVSPTSIATALAMVYTGTAGESATEMEQALYMGTDPGIELSFAALFDSFNDTTTELTGGRPPAPAFDLALANAIWPSDRVTAKEDFVNTIENDYAGIVRSLDYTNLGAKDIINAWVEEQTRGKITNLFTKPINTGTVMTLTNSIYFKALWEMPFDPTLTIPDRFVRSDGTSVDVDMMSFSGWDSAFVYVEDPPSVMMWDTPVYNTQIGGFEILDRQLLGERSSMVFIMPTEQETPNQLTAELLAKVDTWMSSEREPKNIDVYLPKFESTVATDLLPLFTGMMPETFPDGDFSNMLDSSMLVDDARHKAFLEINEQGTEAGAVTSIGGYICFAAGTPVLTADGEKPIEDIRVGDLVLSRDEHNDDGEVRSKKVEETFTGEAEIWELRIEGQVLRVTELHRFFVKDNGWTSVGDMKVGHMLRSTDTERWLAVEDVQATGQTDAVFNFRVADYHTYFVGKSSWGFDVWTHNCCDTPEACRLPEFRANRPFHFIVRENQSSSILFMGRVDDPTQRENTLKPTVQTTSGGDFNGDSVMDLADADALVSAIVAGTNSAEYDLTSDGLVNEQDLDRWRTFAGAANLPSGAAYPRGDVNLDGKVNPMDLNAVGLNWQQHNRGLSGGDSNGDGIVDAIDLNRIGNRWLEDVSVAPNQRVPRAALALNQALVHNQALVAGTAPVSASVPEPHRVAASNRAVSLVAFNLFEKSSDGQVAFVADQVTTSNVRYQRQTMTRRATFNTAKTTFLTGLEHAIVAEVFQHWSELN